MAKAEKMNRGVSSKEQRGGGSEIKLPTGVHSIDAHGNIYASFPELSRIAPKYFTFEQVQSAFKEGRLTTMSGDDFQQLEDLVTRK